jgi:hypothetical protein
MSLVWLMVQKPRHDVALPSCQPRKGRATREVGSVRHPPFAERRVRSFCVFEMTSVRGIARNVRAANEWMCGTVTKAWMSGIPLAKFERNLIRERTYAGLEAARARGRKGGRRKKLGEMQRAVAVDLYRQKKHTIDESARRLESRGRRFRSMSRRLAAHDVRSG